MCGIIGIISNRNVSKILLDSLKKLEYRGYDSAGMVCINENGISIKKDVGKIDEVDKKVNFSELKGSIGLAHSRWSTHGKVTKENAHPHIDCKGNISLVHNGIIENYIELKEKLKGHKFLSETDTEVIVHLIEEYYKGDPVKAVIEALKELKGAYALGIIFKDNPNVLIAARNESPLVIGIGENENFIASDIPAIIKNTKKVIYLDNKEIAALTKDKVDIFDFDGNNVDKKINEIDWDVEQAEKQGYAHFMLKEIFEQPRAIEETIHDRLGENEIVLKELKMSYDEINVIKRIIIVSCGTSWHAGLVGEFMLEELTKIPVEVEYASEFRYRHPIIEKNTLVIAISQSGETADTLAAMREAKARGAKVISICNVVGSSIARESDAVIYTKAGPEIGVASTKAFTSQLVVLYLLTIYFGKIRGVLPEEQVSNRIRDIRRLPLQMQSVLDDAEYAEKLAELYYKKKNALYLGRGIEFPIALEGALKLKEISYVHAEGYPAAEMKHGPIALIDKEMPVVFLATQDNLTYEKVLSNIEEVKSRGGIIIAIATKGDNRIKEKADSLFLIPKTSYILSPVLAVIPLQLLAYYIAVKKECDVDKPKNLSKVVTVE